MAEEGTTIQTNVDLSEDGKQVGFLNIPRPTNRSAWGVARVPFILIRNGKGPTALCIAGVHGDEYEGPVSLQQLAQQWQTEDITGTLMVLPALNLAGVQASTRLSPLDGRDLNRVYPGKYNGTPGERLAHFVSHYLIPDADVVIDIHSGGYSLEFLPCVVTHYTTDQAKWQQRLEALKAFDAPYQVILEELDSQGMLDSYVENLGKLFITTEVGGANQLTPRTVEVTKRGITRTLQTQGILKGELDSARYAEERPLTIMENGFVMAPASGVFEPFFSLGDSVSEGDVVGQIHFMGEPGKPAQQVTSPVTGMIFGRRPPAWTESGDCLLLFATVWES